MRPWRCSRTPQGRSASRCGGTGLSMLRGRGWTFWEVRRLCYVTLKTFGRANIWLYEKISVIRNDSHQYWYATCHNSFTKSSSGKWDLLRALLQGTTATRVDSLSRPVRSAIWCLEWYPQKFVTSNWNAHDRHSASPPDPQVRAIFIWPTFAWKYTHH